MSFAWSFLHVGQSMTANLFHSTSAVSGPKAARRLSERIVGWAFCSCILLACGTFTFRCVSVSLCLCMDRLSRGRAKEGVLGVGVGVFLGGVTHAIGGCAGHLHLAIAAPAVCFVGIMHMLGSECLLLAG